VNGVTDELLEADYFSEVLDLRALLNGSSFSSGDSALTKAGIT